jgi:hypothetical protein
LNLPRNKLKPADAACDVRLPQRDAFGFGSGGRTDDDVAGSDTHTVLVARRSVSDEQSACVELIDERVVSIRQLLASVRGFRQKRFVFGGGNDPALFACAHDSFSSIPSAQRPYSAAAQSHTIE